MGKPLSELLPRNVVHNLSPENANLGQILNAIYIVRTLDTKDYDLKIWAGQTPSVASN